MSNDKNTAEINYENLQLQEGFPYALLPQTQGGFSNSAASSVSLNASRIDGSGEISFTPDHWWRASEACQMNVAALTSPEFVRIGKDPVALLKPLLELGRQIAAQDNRCTDQPMFIVQQKREYPCDDERGGYFESTRVAWFEVNDCEYLECSKDESERLETFRGTTLISKYVRIKLGTVWEFVTACFTEQGCEDYLAINKHNLHETRIYADGSYRNNEFRMVRNFLLELAKLNEVAK